MASPSETYRILTSSTVEVEERFATTRRTTYIATDATNFKSIVQQFTAYPPDQHHNPNPSRSRRRTHRPRRANPTPPPTSTTEAGVGSSSSVQLHERRRRRRRRFRVPDINRNGTDASGSGSSSSSSSRSPSSSPSSSSSSSSSDGPRRVPGRNYNRVPRLEGFVRKEYRPMPPPPWRPTSSTVGDPELLPLFPVHPTIGGHDAMVDDEDSSGSTS